MNKLSRPNNLSELLAVPGAVLPDDQWRRVEIVFWLTVLVLPFLASDYLMLASQILITCLFAMSLDLILGYAGISSLGHAAFFGLGAYTAGILSARGWGEPVSGLLAAGAVAGLVGFATSFLVVRAQELGRLIVTLGVGLVLFEVANQASWLTGGMDGLSDMNTDKLFGLFTFGLDGKTAYAYTFGVTLLLFALMKRVVNSPYGLSVRGIHEGGRRMPAIGANTQAKLVGIFTLGAAVAGVAGGLLAQTTQFVGVDSLAFSRSAELLVMLALGGTGRLYGAIAGTLLFMLAREQLSMLNPAYWQFWVGLLLLVIVIWAPGGILGGWYRLVQRRAMRRASSDKACA